MTKYTVHKSYNTLQHPKEQAFSHVYAVDVQLTDTIASQTLSHIHSSIQTCPRHISIVSLAATGGFYGPKEVCFIWECWIVNIIFCLVVSYCAKFPGNGMGTPVVACTRKEIWSIDEVEFLCKIYLPRNSPFYQPIKVSEQSHYCYGQSRDWAYLMTLQAFL